MSNTLRSLNHLLVILTCAASIWAWMSLPELESYPIHWNAAGEADGFSSKRGVLLVLSLLPITAISTHLLMWFLPKIESINEAVEKSGIVYDVTWHGCLWLYLIMNGVIALMYMSLLKGDASSFDSDLMMRVMPVALGLLFIVLGNVLGKARLNKYVGIKTPWTLKSKSTWDATHRMSTPKKVVLAYSGGLDTSIILKWLQEEKGCEVVTFTADLGQGEELEPARRKAEAQGVKEIYIDDLREEFVRDFVFPMFRANALYEGLYLLGTSIARPLISKRQIEIAHEVGADAVCHGATGKGNDQVRFELGYYALDPDIKVIAPWREWDLNSRTKLIEYAEKHGIEIAKDKRGEAPFSVDANLLHTSSEGKALEDPAEEAPEFVYQRTVSPEAAPDKATYIEVGFERGDAVSINGVAMSPATLLTRLNELGGENGIGRLDLLENRFVGMKSRGIYETPGGTILLMAHRGIEQITMDKGAAHLKDELMPRYAELIYNGYWFAPEREMLQAAIDKSQEMVTGMVRLKLYKGSATIVGRTSPFSLYSQEHVTFEEDDVYDQADAGGFGLSSAFLARRCLPKPTQWGF